MSCASFHPAPVHQPPNSVIVTALALLSTPSTDAHHPTPAAPTRPRLYLCRPHAVTVVAGLSTSAAAHILSPSICSYCGYSVYSASQRRSRGAITHRGGGKWGRAVGGEEMRGSSHFSDCKKKKKKKKKIPMWVYTVVSPR